MKRLSRELECTVVDEREIDLWAPHAPVWGWLWKEIEKLPSGKFLRVDLPDGEDTKKLRKRLGCALRAQFVQHRWRVRISADGTYLAIKENGTWAQRNRELGNCDPPC